MSTVMSANEAPLPASTKALKKIAEANSWLEDGELMRSRSTSLAWKLVWVSIALALMGWAMAVVQMMKPPAPPVRIIVDRTTGDSMVASDADASAPALSVVDQHWVGAYIKACDSYHFGLLKTNFDQCARMSSPAVFMPYSAQYQGDKAKQSTVGSKEEDSVTLVSIRMTGDTKPGQSGVAIATYDKEVTNTIGLPTTTTRYVETLRFEYSPEAMKKPVDRIENPFGFVVIAKQTDQELVSPSAEQSTGKTTSAGSKS
jgi:type IV secretory pathway component VirB8